MEEPEIEARHGVVVARIAQVQKAQKLLVDEVEPQEAVIFARAAVHREGEDTADCAASPACATAAAISSTTSEPAERMQPLPGPAGKQLARAAPDKPAPRPPETPRRSGSSAAARLPGWPPATNAQSAGCGSSSSKRAQECPDRQRDRERQHHVRNQDAREQEQPDAGGHAQPGIEARAFRPKAQMPKAAVSQPARSTKAQSECARPSRARRKSCTSRRSSNRSAALFRDRRRRRGAPSPSRRR